MKIIPILRTATMFALVAIIGSAQVTLDVQPAAASDTMPAVFGEYVDVNALPAPQWQQENGRAVARLTLRSADASAWKLSFRSLSLPEGAQMFLYGTDAATGAVVSVHGPYEDNGPLNIPGFTTGLIPGANLLLEIRAATHIAEWPFQLASAERVGAARIAELSQHNVRPQARYTPPVRKSNPTPDVRSAWVGDRLVMYEVTEDGAVAEGDIVLSNVSGAKSDRKASNINNQTSTLWPNATIPYDFGGMVVDGQYYAMDESTTWTIMQAVNYWNSIYPGMLKKRANESDYVTFRLASGVCQSSVGRVGGGQTIDLAPGCDTGAIVHEIAHAAGLWHEQQRPDRDQHIRINYDNIKPGKKHNFDIPVTAKAEGTYDFASIMHYGSHAFSFNGKPTIEPLVSLPAGVTMGGANVLSAGDRGGIQKLYCTGAVAGGPSIINVDGLTDSYTFTLTLPSMCTWSLSVTGSWIKINSATSGKGTTTVSFTVTTNNTYGFRTGYIRYAGRTTTIKQESLYSGL